MSGNCRTFLFLQGPCSPFFRQLALALRQAGHQVCKINFNAGDVAYWRLGQAKSYRGRGVGLPAFFTRQFTLWGVTDLVLFGDCRPVHQPAIVLARQLGVRVHVFEEGYFRPYRITLERGGVNANSPLVQVLQQGIPDQLAIPSGKDTPFKSPFWRRALHDVLYHVAGAFNLSLYPLYRTHARYNAPQEYTGYILRLPALRWHRGRDDRRLKQLLVQRTRFYVLPLQLDGDSQIREHSPFANMRQAMEQVLQSFARAAPPGTHLLVKNHPLDPGLAGHGRTLRRLAQQLGIADRVCYMETGQLPRILRQAQGVVTINSTVGLLALEANLPVKVLGKALYALPGLVYGGSLDTFWQQGQAPDAQMFKQFKKLVSAQAMVNGGFYCPTGITLAVQNSLPRLLA